MTKYLQVKKPGSNVWEFVHIWDNRQGGSITTKNVEIALREKFGDGKRLLNYFRSKDSASQYRLETA